MIFPTSLQSFVGSPDIPRRLCVALRSEGQQNHCEKAYSPIGLTCTRL